MPHIQTHRPTVPWSWVMWITVPWGGFFYLENVSSAGPLAFTLRKFVENPSLISLLLSLNVAFNFLIGVAASYVSDRIWTRWGRRRPFLVVGWSGVGLSMACIPFANSIWSLALLIVLFQLCADIAKPIEPLYNEVVPPAQRGRAGMIRSIVQNLLGMFFFGVLIVQFDRVHDLNTFGLKWSIRGETVLYWSGSVLILASVLFLIFFVRETPPPESIKRERLILRFFFKEVFGQRQSWNVYLLYSAPLLATVGLDLFKPLLQTEQLGFSKAEMGWSATLGMIVSIFVFIPVAGYLADKTSRMRIFQIGLLAPGVVNLAAFFYLRYMADYTISLNTLIALGLIVSAAQTCLYVVWGPLMYDYIPSNRFGTVSAGLTFVSGIVPFLIMNLAGAWVNGYTKLFGARGASNYDYSSIYVLQFVTALVAFVITLRFTREEKLGRVLPLGRTETARSP